MLLSRFLVVIMGFCLFISQGSFAETTAKSLNKSIDTESVQNVQELIEAGAEVAGKRPAKNECVALGGCNSRCTPIYCNCPTGNSGSYLCRCDCPKDEPGGETIEPASVEASSM